MGDLYPFSLEQKLKVITEPSAYYSQELTPWGRAIIPMILGLGCVTMGTCTRTRSRQ